MECRIVETPEAARKRVMQQNALKQQLQKLITPIVEKYGADAVRFQMTQMKIAGYKLTPFKYVEVLKGRCAYAAKHAA